MGARASRSRRASGCSALTLEVIQRVVFGSRDDELRDALRAALDMTSSTPKLIAMSLTGPTPAFKRRGERASTS